MSSYKMIPTLGMADAVKLASGRLTDFSGRSRRSEFWYWMVVVILLNLIIGQVLVFNLWASFIGQAAVMFLGLSVTARRLQDTGKSALWVYVSYALGILSNGFTVASGLQDKIVAAATDPDALARLMEREMGMFAAMGCLSLLFMIASLLVIIFCIMDGQPAANKYGESPKYVAD